MKATRPRYRSLLEVARARYPELVVKVPSTPSKKTKRPRASTGPKKKRPRVERRRRDEPDDFAEPPNERVADLLYDFLAVRAEARRVYAPNETVEAAPGARPLSAPGPPNLSLDYGRRILAVTKWGNVGRHLDAGTRLMARFVRAKLAAKNLEEGSDAWIGEALQMCVFEMDGWLPRVAAKWVAKYGGFRFAEHGALNYPSGDAEVTSFMDFMTKLRDEETGPHGRRRRNPPPSLLLIFAAFACGCRRGRGRGDAAGRRADVPTAGRAVGPRRAAASPSFPRREDAARTQVLHVGVPEPGHAFGGLLLRDAPQGDARRRRGDEGRDVVEGRGRRGSAVPAAAPKSSVSLFPRTIRVAAAAPPRDPSPWTIQVVAAAPPRVRGRPPRNKM